LVSGIASAAIIALVNTTLMHGDISRGLLAGAFIGLLVGKVLTNALARIWLNAFALRMISQLFEELARKILATPLRHLERVGIARVLATLTDDVPTLGVTLNTLPALAINLAVLAGCSLYLGWLSWPILLAILGFIALGAAAYRVMIARAFRYLRRVRDTRDTL